MNDLSALTVEVNTDSEQARTFFTALVDDESALRTRLREEDPQAVLGEYGISVDGAELGELPPAAQFMKFLELIAPSFSYEYSGWWPPGKGPWPPSGPPCPGCAWFGIAALVGSRL